MYYIACNYHQIWRGGIYEQNSIAESIRIGGWTAGLAIIASNWGNLRELSYRIRRPFPFALVKTGQEKR